MRVQVIPPVEARPGDLFWTSAPGLVASVIRLGTLSRVNHCGVFITLNGDGLWSTLEAFADGHRVRTRTPTEIEGFASILRLHDPDDPKVAERIIDTAIQHQGCPYDWRSIARIGLRAVERIPIVGRWPGASIPWHRLIAARDNPKRVICSDVVAQCAAAAGAVLSRPSFDTSPAEIREELLDGAHRIRRTLDAS